MSAPDQELLHVDRRNGERLVVRWRLYEGSHFVDLRVFYRAANGEYRPTQKGVSIRMSELFAVADAIKKACELALEVRR